ncbi:MAG: SDR family oxidoreductase [Bacteroidota bacterium]|nr:SDR family oxidoreductase [Bacteroidota bacterium]
MSTLENKIIVVTGGSGLLGKAIVAKIREQGGIAVNADMSCSDTLHDDGIRTDVTNRESIEQMLRSVIEGYGRLDGLVNSAYPRTKDWGNAFDKIDPASWQRNVEMQLNSIFSVCQLTLPVMQRQQFGSIVNIASIYGVVGPDFSVYEGTPMTMPAAYAAIKGGLINFTRYLSSYAGHTNVRVNCVSPGGIFDGQPVRFVEQYSRKVPMKRMGTPVEIAGPVCFLLSDDASYITGHNLLVDGGWTAI